MRCRGRGRAVPVHDLTPSTIPRWRRSRPAACAPVEDCPSTTSWTSNSARSTSRCKATIVSKRSGRAPPSASSLCLLRTSTIARPNPGVSREHGRGNCYKIRIGERIPRLNDDAIVRRLAYVECAPQRGQRRPGARRAARSGAPPCRARAPARIPARRRPARRARASRTSRSRPPGRRRADPGARRPGSPRPSSVTDAWITPSRSVTLTTALVACAWRLTFVSASCTTR